MASGFEMNPNFEEEIGQQVRQVFQAVFDKVFKTHAGRSVPEVKTALTREFARDGVTFTDPEHTAFATAISEGTHIRVRAA